MSSVVSNADLMGSWTNRSDEKSNAPIVLAFPHELLAIVIALPREFRTLLHFGFRTFYRNPRDPRQQTIQQFMHTHLYIPLGICYSLNCGANNLRQEPPSHPDQTATRVRALANPTKTMCWLCDVRSRSASGSSKSPQ